jgi:hypothetical protein
MNTLEGCVLIFMNLFIHLPKMVDSTLGMIMLSVSILPGGSLVMAPPMTVPGMQLAHKLTFISVTQCWFLFVLRFINSDAVLSISVECDYIDKDLDD